MPNAPLVVMSKLTPPLSAGVIARDCAGGLLDRGRNAKLILVTAPAGYGKTTAVAQHFNAERESGEAIGWVSLDNDDRDPSRFLGHVVAALQTAHTGVGLAAQSLLSVGSEMPVRSILLTLLNEVSTVGRPVTIVLDDFYRCAGDEVLAMIDNMLEAAPRNLRLIITSRSMPTLRSLGRFRVQNELVEVRAEHLRFELSETYAFLNDREGLDLSREQVSALHERTDGWIAGLQLASLSLRDRPDREHFITAFSGSNRNIVDYLATDVLSNLPVETRAFLQETAILERLNAPLCDTVAGRSDSAAMLVELEQANMFLLPLDDERTWYRYHHLFADFLRRHLAEDRPGDVQMLHRRAYGWYAANGMIGEAVGHALAAGDWDETADFIETSWHNVLKMGRIRTILDWIERLPQEVQDRRPLVRIAHCWVLALRRDCERGLQVFKSLSSQIEADDFDTGGMSERDLCALRAELRTTETFIHVFADAEEAMVAIAKEEPEDAPEFDPFVRGVHDNLLIYANFVAGDFDKARRFSARARERHMRADGVYGAVYSDCLRGLVEVCTGQLDVAETLYTRAFGLASERLGRLSLPAALPAALVSEVHYLRNDIEPARQNLNELLHMVDECAILDAMLVGRRVLAQIYVADGQEGAALDVLAESEAIGRHTGFARLVVSALGQRARILASIGDMAGAETAVNEAEGVAGQRQTGSTSRWSRRHVLTVLARGGLLLAQGRPEEVQELLKPVLIDAGVCGRVRWQIELLVLDAIAKADSGDEPAAIRQIGRALSLSSRTGMIRTYVDEGPAAKRLLLKAHASWAENPSHMRLGVPSVHLELVLDAFGRDGLFRGDAAVLEIATGERPDLSDRERDVLKAVFVGQSNKQIARELGVAESTVAWHLRNIYSKLNVTRRTEAVAAALAHSLF
ncbi:MAG: LuxR C-terminal-related transcriptional regulator [Parvibaculum sp.]|uniref:LuxR C-terminal-related transcriptional regulator n=1 Tax=Parvibaculum sp. TaxID=2024848 RepID=UPI0025E8BBC9|nr:LuxR C-terminal-related transcriptional regulator [Parvibaculum sp.]MCE9648475.1 LuxR C-terminal-related transcriptional regulator [Parvibaculum sp.]